MQGLAAGEGDLFAVQFHQLVALGVQVHFDAAGVGVVHGAMGEGGGVEVSAQGGVHMGQDVAIETGGDAGVVVVGAQQYVRVLLRVNADDQAAAGLHEAGGVAQENVRRRRIEIADAGAGKERHPGQTRRRCRQLEGACEIGAGGIHGKVRIVVEHGAGGGHQVIFGNVHGHIGARAAGVQQNANLGAAAAAVLHQAAAGGHLGGDRPAIGAQDGNLRSRQVILRQPRDGVEQLRAGGVVEELGRNRLLRQLQAAHHLGGHVRGRGFAIEQRERGTAGSDDGQPRATVRAKRMPVNCQRSLG